MLADGGTANAHRGGGRKWVRYERTYSNSMWHAGWTRIRGGMHDGRWLLCYQDDASRFVAGYGMFDEATAQNALAVLDAAVGNHGRPASIMTGRGSQFYADERENAAGGAGPFERRLVELGIRQALAGVNRPQTNGKLGRLYGEIRRKLHEFEGIMMRKSDPIDLFMQWYNHDRPHMSLDWENRETPAQAFERRMPEGGRTAVDGQAGEGHDVGEGAGELPFGSIDKNR